MKQRFTPAQLERREKRIQRRKGRRDHIEPTPTDKPESEKGILHHPLIAPLAALIGLFWR